MDHDEAVPWEGAFLGEPNSMAVAECQWQPNLDPLSAWNLPADRGSVFGCRRDRADSTSYAGLTESTGLHVLSCPTLRTSCYPSPDGKAHAKRRWLSISLPPALGGPLALGAWRKRTAKTWPAVGPYFGRLARAAGDGPWSGWWPMVSNPEAAERLYLSLHTGSSATSPTPWSSLAGSRSVSSPPRTLRKKYGPFWAMFLRGSSVRLRQEATSERGRNRR